MNCVIVSGQMVPMETQTRSSKRAGSERTAVAAIQLRMRMRILTRPENSLANFNHQITNKSCELSVAKEFASANAFMRKFRPRCGNSLRMEVCDKIR